MLLQSLKQILPEQWRRRAEVFLVDHGLPVRKKLGSRGIRQLGHRGYVGRAEVFEAAGDRQFQFLLENGLAPSQVLCDIGCGSLRAGRLFIEYLDRGNYLGLEAEEELVTLGLAHEISRDTVARKAPEFVISTRFEFERFSKSPDVALGSSVFSHLSEADIRLCLTKLAQRVTGRCDFFTSFFAVLRACPNFKRSHAHLGFYYTLQQMEGFGAQAGWTSTFIGEWGSPSGQQMIRFSIAK